jgi:ribosomal protein L11 methyltransferase
VPADGEAAEALFELFERYGGGAVVELLAPAAGAPAAAGPADGMSARVTTYLAADDVQSRARLEVGLWHLSQLHPIAEPTVRRVEAQDWATAWRQHFTPQAIGPFLIAPSWCEVQPGPDQHLIRLDPGMAFGTGLHPSTRLCLLALAEAVAPGDAVLDVGTGSGILAIAAARLGAAPVVALDIDPQAVAIALANAAANGVTLAPVAGRLEDQPPAGFDLVLANLLAPTLVTLAPSLAERTRAGGTLVASGVLSEQAEAVGAALGAAGFRLAATPESGDWVALVARRAPP